MAERSDLPHPVVVSFHEGFRLFVGRGRKFSVAELALATPVNERTLKSYQEQPIDPALSNFVAIAAVLPGLAGKVLAHAGLAAVPIEDSPAGRLARCDLSTAANVAQLMSGLAEALRDGHIDHRERRPLAEEARALAQQLLAWADRESAADLKTADILGRNASGAAPDRAAPARGSEPRGADPPDNLDRG